MITKEVQIAARKFHKLWKREHQLHEERLATAERLAELLKMNGLVSVGVGEDLVQLMIQKQKRASKGRVASFFGEEPATQFWDQLPTTVSEYLTVIGSHLAPVQAVTEPQPSVLAD